MAVLFDKLDAEVLAAFLGFLQKTRGHIVMMHVDRTDFHGLDSFSSDSS